MTAVLPVRVSHIGEIGLHPPRSSLQFRVQSYDFLFILLYFFLFYLRENEAFSHFSCRIYTFYVHLLVRNRTQYEKNTPSLISAHLRDGLQKHQKRRSQFLNAAHR